MHLSQPAVSRQIANLEADLGVKLFVRGPRSIALTDAGECLYRHVDQMMDLAEQAKRLISQMADPNHGRVAVGVCGLVGTYILPRVLAGFSQSHPGIQVNLRFAGESRVCRMVGSGEVDLGVIAGGIPAPGIHLEPVGRERLVMVAPPGTSPPVVFTLGPDTAVGRLVREREAASGNRIEVVDHVETVKAMVAAGLGKGYVPGFAVGSDADLVSPDDAGGIILDINLVWPKDRQKNPATLVLASYLQKHFADGARETQPFSWYTKTGAC